MRDGDDDTNDDDGDEDTYDGDDDDDVDSDDDGDNDRMMLMMIWRRGITSIINYVYNIYRNPFIMQIVYYVSSINRIIYLIMLSLEYGVKYILVLYVVEVVVVVVWEIVIVLYNHQLIW